MTPTHRWMSRGAALAVASVAFLLGMQVDALARVMWVEDRVGANDGALVDLVNGNPPSLIVMTILALAGVGLGYAVWLRDRRLVNG